MRAVDLRAFVNTLMFNCAAHPGMSGIFLDLLSFEGVALRARWAWRLGADDFFHMEVGYWLYEPATGLIHRCFMVPRSTTIVAIGEAAADATSFKLSAKEGSPTNGILSNAYLYDGAARSISFELAVDLADGKFACIGTQLIESVTALVNHLSTGGA